MSSHDRSALAGPLPSRLRSESVSSMSTLAPLPVPRPALDRGRASTSCRHAALPASAALRAFPGGREAPLLGRAAVAALGRLAHHEALAPALASVRGE